MLLSSFKICLIICYICFSYLCCYNFLHSLTIDANHIGLLSQHQCQNVIILLFLCYIYFTLFVDITLHKLHFIPPPPSPRVVYVTNVVTLSIVIFLCFRRSSGRWVVWLSTCVSLTVKLI